PVRQPDAHAWLRGNGARGGLAADRGARRARHPGPLHLLPFLAGRRPPDLGRAGDNAPRRRRLPPRRPPHHAAHHRLPELSSRPPAPPPPPQAAKLGVTVRRGRGVLPGWYVRSRGFQLTPAATYHFLILRNSNLNRLVTCNGKF